MIFAIGLRYDVTNVLTDEETELFLTAFAGDARLTSLFDRRKRYGG